jgi:hypothetical protein
MTKEEAAVVQKAIELVDMWDGVRGPNESSATLHLYQAVARLKATRAAQAGGKVC